MGKKGEKGKVELNEPIECGSALHKNSATGWVVTEIHYESFDYWF